MTQTQITLFFLAIIVVIATAMLVHSFLDKRRMAGNFRRFLSRLPRGITQGSITQENPLAYPQLSVNVNGRTLYFFFTVVKVGKQQILYCIYSLAAAIKADLLLLKSDRYKPADLSETVLLPEINPQYQARSHHPEAATTLLTQVHINDYLKELDEFATLQIGPDALVAGKPYDGISDTEPENILRNINALEGMAKGVEQCPV